MPLMNLFSARTRKWLRSKRIVEPFDMYGRHDMRKMDSVRAVAFVISKLFTQMVSTVSDMLTSVIDKGITTDEDGAIALCSSLVRFVRRLQHGLVQQVVNFVGTMVNMLGTKLLRLDFHEWLGL